MVKRAQPQVKRKNDRPPRRCKGCDTQFIPERDDQVYHDGKCRESYYLRTYYVKTLTTKVCLYCDSEFQTSKPMLQDYCPKKDCRRNAAIKRMKEQRQEYKDLKAQHELAYKLKS